jgi:hypothetical protein
MPYKFGGPFVNARPLVVGALLLAGCSGGVLPAALPLTLDASQPAAGAHGAVRTSKYVYVADRTREELLVYPAHEASPRPIRRLGASQGIVEVGGVATDAAGDVYLANGDGGNVLEFAPGATSRVREYRRLLSHPVNVAVDAKGTLYVVDQDDDYSTGATSSVVEFPKDVTVPSTLLLDPSMSYFPMRGIAVDGSGSVFVSTTPAQDVWPPKLSSCTLPATDQIYDYILPTLIMPITLADNAQAWGLAFDGNILYASDICGGAVQMYDKGTWVRVAPMPYHFDEPVYQTVSADHLLTIPCAGKGKHGYVAVVNLLNGEHTTITAGLRGPIGAAAGP